MNKTISKIELSSEWEIVLKHLGLEEYKNIADNDVRILILPEKMEIIHRYSNRIARARIGLKVIT